MLTRWNHPSLRLASGIAAFIFVLIASRAILPILQADLLRVIAVWIPIVPAAFIGFGLLTMIRRMDEFQKRVQVDAASFALVGTLLVLIALAIIDETPRSLLVFLVVLALWLIGWIVSRRRYT